MLRVIKHRKIWFILSGLLVGTSLVLLVVWRLKPGIDFRGGSLSELEFGKVVAVADTQGALAAAGFHDVVVQPVSDKTVIIKTEALDEQQAVKFKDVLTSKFGAYKELSFESIGPNQSRVGKKSLLANNLSKLRDPFLHCLCFS